MANRKDMETELKFRRDAVAKLREAYLALVDGGVSQYSIGSRSLTKLDIKTISAEITAHEKKIASLEAQLAGGKRRKAVGVVICDW